ncbi:MAG: penicillin-binding protein activator [Burkholderiales bacterium]
MVVPVSAASLVAPGKRLVAALAALALAACAAAPRPREVPAPPPRPIIAAPAPVAPTPVTPAPAVRIPAPPMTPPEAAAAPAPPVAAAPPAPPPPTAPAEPPPAPAAEPPGDSIALVLPLAAPSYARAAEAFRDGFLAAADAAGMKDSVEVIGHDADGVLSAFEDARARNPRVVVGPLVRDDLKVLAELGLDMPYTIALNQLEDGAPLPPRVYSFPLAIESDARLIARRMRADGVANAAVISTETPLMRRFANAFAVDLRTAGGTVPDLYKLDPTVEGLTGIRRALQRKPANALLLALDGANAALAKPYLGVTPAYASGLVFERVPDSVARDLDKLVLVDIPWLLTPDAPQLANLPRAEFASNALTRLYAFGLDAFRVARAFREGPPAQFTLDGATGVVTLDGRQFTREGRFAIFEAGRLVPLDAPPP